MRGREKDAFLTELHVRSTAEPSGRPASAGWTPPRYGRPASIPPPLPELPGSPQTAGTPPSLTAGAVAAPGIDPVALEHLVGRTAVEAYRLLAAGPGRRPAGRRWSDPAQDARPVGLWAGSRRRDRAASPRGRGVAVTGSRRLSGPGGWGAAALGRTLDEEREVEGVAPARARAASGSRLGGGRAAGVPQERQPVDGSGRRFSCASAVRATVAVSREGGCWVPAGGAMR
ncbi:hypothetical protein LT493_01935 [Streptomyces tricolor]|nr:hypothetical protein [Streptomyces tricolor]